jgi:prepilin-type N-terminal cleavage/methylation domain-containing protein
MGVPRKIQKRALTLIELMMVIVIIGILASVAVPSYREYILRTRLAEAYVGLGAIRTSQKSFFEENKNFMNFEMMMIQSGRNKFPLGNTEYNGPTYDAGGYSLLGGAVAPGTMSWWGYNAWAGRVHSNGDTSAFFYRDDTKDSVWSTGDVIPSQIGGFKNQHLDKCWQDSPFGDFFSVPQDWAIIQAGADFEMNELGSMRCSLVVFLLGSEQSWGPILLNAGE